MRVCTSANRERWEDREVSDRVGTTGFKNVFTDLEEKKPLWGDLPLSDA